MEPQLKIEQIPDDEGLIIYKYLDYGEDYADSYNHRWLIQYKPNRNKYYLICTFPYTHENGLDNCIKEIELAKEAIDILKKKNIS